VATSPYLMFINDITVMSSSENLQLLIRIKFLTKRIFRIFSIWKTNRIVTYLSNDPRIIKFFSNIHISQDSVEKHLQCGEMRYITIALMQIVCKVCQ